ncbi:Hypothetical protein CINCED_3A019452 [Cinara cedri]|uniref:Uncharacterized protein n=1 Tax=Cinara cedri TaxID=506608 RepID=A0A5E4MS13_9HEMI|nr:Hypothetical protein CINCED_3A019452 [Cinara cedri]
MVFTHLLVSAITVSMVLVRIANTVPADLTFEYENIDSGSKNSTTVIAKDDNPLDDNDRDSNLKYVMAIKNSSMWTEIKRRSLTISTDPYSKSLFDKSTENLSDQELLQLKQVCQDGLKCVAVDQLMVLRQVKQTDGGKTVVHKAINKITKVLTDYTNEYHEEKYQYEAVTDADDTDKMYDSVMTIMEDNRELCQIDPNTYTSTSTSSYDTTSSSINISSAESSNNSSDSSSNNIFDGNFNGISNTNSDSSSNHSSDRSLTENSDSALLTIFNNGNVNFGTVNQYNVNEGTMNSAMVGIEPSNSTSSDDSSKLSEEPNPPPTIRNESPAINDPPTSTIDPPPTLESNTERPVEKRTARIEYLIPFNGEQKQNVSNDKIPESDSLPEKTVSSVQTAASADTGPSTYCSTCANAGTSTSTDNSTSDAGVPAKTDESSADTVNNFINMDNGENSAFSKNDSMVDITSTGSNNKSTVNKGYVEDGNFNNGMMKIFNMNTGTINKGVISNSVVEDGIINVGTVNNGPANYGQVNSSSNNGTESQVNNNDVQKFASAIEKIYSDMYDRLSKQ